MKMTDTEINEAVAVKLGWRQCVHDHGNEIRWNKPEMVNCAFRVPDYCRSIAAAWEVVEHLQGPSVNRIVQLTYGNLDKKWSFGLRGDRAADIWEIWIDADTAPMAICLAFLKLETK